MYRKRLDIAQKPARILKDCFAPTTRSCGTFCVRNKYGMREESEWYVGSVKLRTGANTGTEQTRLEECEKGKLGFVCGRGPGHSSSLECNEREAAYLSVPTDKVSCTLNLVVLNISYKSFKSRSIKEEATVLKLGEVEKCKIQGASDG